MRRAHLHHRETGDDRDAAFERQPQPAGKALVRLLGDLEIIVIEADETEADRDEQDDPDIAALEIGPEQRRDDEAGEDHQAAHRRRALFSQKMRLRPVLADRLALALLEPQSRDDARPEEEDEEQRRRCRARSAERDVAEQIQRAENMRETGEPK